MTAFVVNDEQLGIVARRQHDLFRRVRDGSLPAQHVLVGLQRLIEGEFNGRRCIIDGDAKPYDPVGGQVQRHVECGQLEFDPDKIQLYQSEKQRDGGRVSSETLFDEVWKTSKTKWVLNTNVLFHLLANTNLIPETWKQDDRGKSREIWFLGTLYWATNCRGVNLFLRWEGCVWRWYYRYWDENELGRTATVALLEK